MVTERVEYLLRRAGFGVTPAEAAVLASRGLEAVVDGLLAAGDEPEEIAPPDLAKEPYSPEKLADIQAYWLHRMITTRRPLVEKMTLFWHGHFATGVKKAKPVLMQRQNELLRRHALGAFPALLRAVGKDPAMLLWLDGHGSTRKAPNENYAREVMELFTTGPGPYTETDVREAARAFTGWRVDETGEAQFVPKRWDPGVKTVLGRTGAFGADEIAAILAERPETARFLAAKLWRFFASPTPVDDVVQQMASAYAASGGQVRPMLRVLFLSDAFYAAGPLVKSPVELVAGTLRLCGLPATRDAAWWATRMGQTLYDPPNVAGWPGGTAWLGATSLLARWNLGEGVKVLLGQNPRSAWMEAGSPAELVDRWLAHFGITAGVQTRQALLGLVGPALPADEKKRWELVRNLIRTVIAAPEYQVS